VSFVLDSPDASALFASGARLPPGYGIGFDERVVEYPWLQPLLSQGRVLDAGSSLNHPHVLDRFLPRVAELHIVTLAPEPFSLVEQGLSYVYADLRDLPFPDEHFDAIVSLSTLEHVGMDTSPYGVHAPRAEDPAGELRRAVKELARVLAPGGALLVTVPYGAREDHGWFRQFDRADVESLVSLAAPRRPAIDVFRYTAEGWQTSSLEEAAHERYHDHHADANVPADRAAAARAVACLRFEGG
jgi:SAM-dependent methyltransferase